MQILRAADHRRMPWKNGKGVTVEIAIHPPQASVDDFDWRLSMATVDSNGPFSAFAGVERSLAVLTGEGIVLSVAERPDAVLTPAADPYSFPADAATSARLIGGAITDLNAMSRRGRVGHQMERIALEGRLDLDLGPGVSIIFCASGEAAVGDAFIGAMDALRVEGDAPATLALTGGALLYLVTFGPGEAIDN